LVKLDHPSSGALSPTAAAPSPLSATAATPTTTPAPAAASDAVAGTVPSTVPAAPATAGPTSSACTNDVVGPTVNTRWGPVQVEALLSADGRVCDIQAVQSPGGRGRSLSINQYALPILHDRAVQAAASFDGVTGATVTSEGYRASLQAILDGG
ncbi:MAG TPA: FMN-binding protein, partial [Acidimicrobiales bacterium]